MHEQLIGGNDDIRGARGRSPTQRNTDNGAGAQANAESCDKQDVRANNGHVFLTAVTPKDSDIFHDVNWVLPTGENDSSEDEAAVKNWSFPMDIAETTAVVGGGDFEVVGGSSTAMVTETESNFGDDCDWFDDTSSDGDVPQEAVLSSGDEPRMELLSVPSAFVCKPCKLESQSGGGRLNSQRKKGK